jgi:chromatin remodeling complex protein RSC6
MSETTNQPEQVSHPTVVVEDNTDVILESIDDLVDRVDEYSKGLRTIAAELNKLKKEYGKAVKKIAGSKKKKVPRDPDAPKKAPSGFAKPTKISAELAAFLGLTDGQMVARPDVTKGINRYVKENNLQNESNKREIDLSKPGGKVLTDLLNVPENEKLTFFNLQKYLKIHFPAGTKEVKAPSEKKTKTKKSSTKLEIHEESGTDNAEHAIEVPMPAAPVETGEVPVEETKVRTRKVRTKEQVAAPV